MFEKDEGKLCRIVVSISLCDYLRKENECSFSKCQHVHQVCVRRTGAG